mmetsp:Transcript_34704/g.83850  ORF Transcript_34704/g.83850 Transcript_34704/m.83850 type:complete len:222 (+) Transcript_34704:25-690(+)
MSGLGCFEAEPSVVPSTRAQQAPYALVFAGLCIAGVGTVSKSYVVTACSVAVVVLLTLAHPAPPSPAKKAAATKDAAKSVSLPEVRPHEVRALGSTAEVAQSCLRGDGEGWVGSLIAQPPARRSKLPFDSTSRDGQSPWQHTTPWAAGCAVVNRPRQSEDSSRKREKKGDGGFPQPAHLPRVHLDVSGAAVAQVPTTVSPIDAALAAVAAFDRRPQAKAGR